MRVWRGGALVLLALLGTTALAAGGAGLWTRAQFGSGQSEARVLLVGTRLV